MFIHRGLVMYKKTKRVSEEIFQIKFPRGRVKKGIELDAWTRIQYRPRTDTSIPDTRIRIGASLHKTFTHKKFH